MPMSTQNSFAAILDGFRRGGLHAILAPAQSGKTTLALELMNAAQMEQGVLSRLIAINRSVDQTVEKVDETVMDLPAFRCDDQGRDAPLPWGSLDEWDRQSPWLEELEKFRRDEFGAQLEFYDGVEALFPIGSGKVHKFAEEFFGALAQTAKVNKSAVVVIATVPSWWKNLPESPVWDSALTLSVGPTGLRTAKLRLQHDAEQEFNFKFAGKRLVPVEGDDVSSIEAWFAKKGGEVAVLDALRGLRRSRLITSQSDGYRKVDALVKAGKLEKRDAGRTKFLSLASI
jgi:hypothetical protein